MAKYIPWSFSALDNFEGCPRRFYHLRVIKSVKEPESEHLRYGKQQHEHMEHYVNGHAGLPERLAHVGPMVDALKAKYPTVKAEVEWAVDINWKPCGWRDWDIVAARCKADFVAMDDTECVALDWKTGKIKDTTDQLRLTAAFVFAHHPHIQRVKAAYIWLEHRKHTPLEVGVDEFMATRDEFSDRAAKIQAAQKAGKWQPRPSGLCGWCPLSTQHCEFKKTR